MADDEARNRALEEWRKKIVAHKEVESKVRALRDEVREAKKEYDKTEDDLKALQSVGQIIGEVLRQLDEERCECGPKGGRRAIRVVLESDRNADSVEWAVAAAAVGLLRRLCCLLLPSCISTVASLSAVQLGNEHVLMRHSVPCSHCQVQQRAAVRGGLPLQG